MKTKHEIKIEKMERTGKPGAYFSFSTVTGTVNGKPFTAVESGERGRMAVGGKTVWRTTGDVTQGERIAISRAVWKHYWSNL